jgi:hypothetical protein
MLLSFLVTRHLAFGGTTLLSNVPIADSVEMSVLSR